MQSFYEEEDRWMKNWNVKLTLVVFLTGILICTGCAIMEENVSKGYSDNTMDDAFI
jgi:hypothetical protein